MSDEIRIVRGAPTDEELAAVVGVLMLRQGDPTAPPSAPASRWAASSRLGHSRRTKLGPNAWRTAALPQ